VCWIQFNLFCNWCNIYIDGAGNNKNVILNPVSTGNILVGTTTDNGSKFQVNGAATFASSVTNSSFSESHLAFSTIKRNKFGDKKYS
jgi:hypothetical protein